MNNIELAVNDTEFSTLPTAKEYIEYYRFENEFHPWSKPKYQCPKCGGGMCKDLTMMLTTYPPKYMYQCCKCGYTESQFV